MYRKQVTDKQVGMKSCLPSKMEDSEAEESGTEESGGFGDSTNTLQPPVFTTCKHSDRTGNVLIPQ